jgi:hypothetical protein
MRARQTKIIAQKRRQKRPALNIPCNRFPVNSHRYDRHLAYPFLKRGAALHV